MSQGPHWGFCASPTAARTLACAPRRAAPCRGARRCRAAPVRVRRSLSHRASAPALLGRPWRGRTQPIPELCSPDGVRAGPRARRARDVPPWHNARPRSVHARDAACQHGAHANEARGVNAPRLACPSSAEDDGPLRDRGCADSDLLGHLPAPWGLCPPRPAPHQAGDPPTALVPPGSLPSLKRQGQRHPSGRRVRVRAEGPLDGRGCTAHDGYAQAGGSCLVNTVLSSVTPFVSAAIRTCCGPIPSRQRPRHRSTGHPNTSPPQFHTAHFAQLLLPPHKLATRTQRTTRNREARASAAHRARAARGSAAPRPGFTEDRKRPPSAGAAAPASLSLSAFPGRPLAWPPRRPLRSRDGDADQWHRAPNAAGASRREGKARPDRWTACARGGGISARA